MTMIDEIREAQMQYIKILQWLLNIKKAMKELGNHLDTIGQLYTSNKVPSDKIEFDCGCVLVKTEDDKTVMSVLCRQHQSQEGTVK